MRKASIIEPTRLSLPDPVDGGPVLTGYIDDADGTRVSKGTITARSCNPAANGYATTSDYILGHGGKQFSEYTMSGSATANSLRSSSSA